MSDPRALLEASFRHALSATDAGRLVQEHLPEERPALIMAVGKAALPMVAEASRAYPDASWLATPPAGGSAELGTGREAAAANGELMPGSHPLPDARSVAAAERALKLTGALRAGELLLLLVSGGGSALWSAPWGGSSQGESSRAGSPQAGSSRGGRGGVDLQEKRAVTLALQRAGADIHELNTVRRHLSRIKGGRLAAASPARVLTLALSDVPGDALEDIASGPTVPDPTTFADALATIRRHGIDLPAVERHLELGAAGGLPETLKPGSEPAGRSEARVIGSAGKLLEAAAAFWRQSGHEPVILSDRLQGEAEELAEAHALLVSGLLSGRVPDPALARLVGHGPRAEERLAEVSGQLSAWLSAASRRPPLVLLSGGEATVTVQGSGRGGRNLEFAAWLLHHLLRALPAGPSGRSVEGGERAEMPPGVWALSAGSDGVDGSSEAAGAFLTPDSGRRVAVLQRGLADYLKENDTDALFADLGDRLITGPTGNNLNDYRAVIVPAQRD